MMARGGIFQKTVLALLMLASVIGLQVAYDRAKPAGGAAVANVIPPGMVRMFDFGFHSTVASFIWIPTLPEILDLFHGHGNYLVDVTYVNAVDPRLSYPYAFSVLTLPVVPKKSFPDAVKAATEIGLRGLANADPDWRIPYYMATNYYLLLKDKATAQKYYDIAAQTPGVPAYAARFSLNFGIGSNERATTRELWTTIRDSTNDELSKERAQAYIDRLDMFDYLEAASRVYRQKYGVFPKKPEDLVSKGIIPAVPEDPFGFSFVINSDGTSGIDLNKLPAYLENAPQQ